MMHTDLMKLRQCLVNLVSNANKFTERGTITLTLERDPAEDGEQVAFSVTDTGIGMSPRHMARLFQPFAQADSSTTRRLGGTGLGLAITRHLCTVMGGDVKVTSELGRGSTFVMRIPASLRSGSLTTSSVVAADPAPHGGRTVLIIDDDGTARELMTRFLEREGYYSAWAASGAEGLRLARRLQPAAILLDVLMPGMDGWTVLAALKSEPLTSEIPVIMLTMVDDRTLGYALGAADYLLKPVDRERLRIVVRRCAGAGDQALRSVMVMDDDPDARRLLRRALETEGYDVIEARDGREAVALLTVRAPDLILLDPMMHRMEGLQLARDVRVHPEWGQIPIVVMTGRDLTTDERARLVGDVDGTRAPDGSAVDQLLEEVAHLIASSVRRSRAPKTEPI